MSLNAFYKNAPFLLLLAAFGPYIHTGFGLRIEHVLIYPLAAIMLILFFFKKPLFIKETFLIMGLWFLTGFYLVVRSVFGGNVSSNSLKFLAELESFMQPLAILFALSMILIKFDPEDSRNRLVKASLIVVTLLSLNTVWSLTSMFIDLTAINVHFWGSEDSVASRAMTMGRYSGIFNQPVEAGVVYSIGLLAWLYLSERVNIFKLRYTLALLLLVVGGLLTVSKVFIFGGLLLFVVGIVLNRKVLKLTFSIAFWSLIVGIPASNFLFANWNGVNYLLRFFNSDQQTLDLVTAGRLGGETGLTGLFKSVWQTNPLIGRGFGVNTVYDNEFFYFFANGGIIGLFFYFLVAASLIILALTHMRKSRSKAESKFLLFIVILLIGSSIGAPVLTLNRVSIVLWVLIGLLIQYFYYSKDVEVAEPIFEKKKRRMLRYKITW